MLTVLIKGGGPDAAQFTPGQHRFQQIAGVHGATAGASAHHRVDLIDEQHDLSIGGGDLLQHRLEPFFELTAVLRPGDQGTHVEGNELSVLQGLGHITIDDPLCQALDDCCFADPGFTDQYGVVLGAAAENLNGAADLFIPSDHRVQLTIAGRCCEIAAVFLQGFVGGLRVLVCHRLVAAHRRDRLLECVGGHPGLAEQLPAAAIILRQGQEQMLDGDEAVAESIPPLLGSVEGRVEGAAEKHRIGCRAKAGQPLQMAFNTGLEGGDVNAGFAEDSPGQSVLSKQRQQQMFRFQLLVPGGLGELLGRDDGGPGLFGELFGRGLHMTVAVF